MVSAGSKPQQQPMAKEIPKDCIIYHLITLYEFEPSVKISLLPKGTESAVWLVEDKKDLLYTLRVI